MSDVTDMGQSGSRVRPDYGVVGVAWCPQHGLHGCRSTCFECGQPVPKVAMIAVDELLGDEAIERLLAETNRQYPLLVNEIWAKRVLQAVLGVS